MAWCLIKNTDRFAFVQCYWNNLQVVNPFRAGESSEHNFRTLLFLSDYRDASVRDGATARPATHYHFLTTLLEIQ
jgi:hypothetical protein